MILSFTAKCFGPNVMNHHEADKVPNKLYMDIKYEGQYKILKVLYK
jgi:hypothetical protein